MRVPTAITLRPYQEAAKAAVYDHLRTRDDNPCVVIPTAGGKTPLLASICTDAARLWAGRVLVLAHVRELLEQAADKLAKMCPDVRVGIYSAGLGHRDKDAAVVVAGIQSVFRRACELGAFDLILIDEAHLVTMEGEGMYRQFLAEAMTVNPSARVIGFTATPFRMKDGPICTLTGFLNHVCYEVGIKELIADGYLCPLITKAGTVKADLGGVRVRAGEYAADDLEQVMDDGGLVTAACAEIVELAADRKAVLIFASGVSHAHHICDHLYDNCGVDCGIVTGETPSAERANILQRFLDGQLKYLVNVNVLTTGFDAPNIDCVALLRPTLSPGLYYQMVGRGFRTNPGKANCLVLDYGGNTLRHGPVDQLPAARRLIDGAGIAPAKECPECHSVVAAGYATCPDCGHEFPPPVKQAHDTEASDAAVLSGQVTLTMHNVSGTQYSTHRRRNAGNDAPQTMRVDYEIGCQRFQSEWVCFEHDGYARQKAEQWWRRRSPDRVPDSAEEAVNLARAGRLAPTVRISVRSISGEKYDRIAGYSLGEMPKPANLDDQQFSADALDFKFGDNEPVGKEPW